MPKQIGLFSSVGNKWPGYWIQCVLYCKLWPISSLRLLVLDSPHGGISGVFVLVFGEKYDLHHTNKLRLSLIFNNIDQL